MTGGEDVVIGAEMGHLLDGCPIFCAILLSNQ